MSGQLFTQYYLTEGIKSTTRWNSAAANVQTFRDRVRQRYDALNSHSSPNEAVTEQELIRPVLELLGWNDYLPQQGTGRNEDIPDLLLFAGADSKDRAAARTNPNLRYADALAVEESKRFGLPLDARDEHDLVRARTPHGQILRYLRAAEDAPEGGARWGILTNGGLWRLYDQRARPRATGYFEVDLADAASLLNAVRLPDAAFAPIVHDLSHTETDGERRFVNYRDMSVQQLGSIYERLLEREPVFGGGGRIVIRPNPYARKDSGSFYTPQGACRPDSRPHAQAAGRRASRRLRAQVGGAEERPPPQV